MLEFRSGQAEPALKLTWDEFEQMVRRGQVAPTDLVRARVITGDDWWTADNLAIFHRANAVKHPYGEHLAAEVDAKKRRAEVEWQERRTELEYHWIRDFEDGLRLTPLPLLVAQPGVLAASRFITRPAFSPDRVVTCVYAGSELRIEVITNWARGLSAHLTFPLTSDAQWSACPRVHLPLVSAQRESAIIDATRAPQPLQTPRTLVAASNRAPPCSTMTLDGVGYHHFVMQPTEMLYAYWSNPSPAEHAPQLMLVAAYESLLSVTGRLAREEAE